MFLNYLYERTNDSFSVTHTSSLASQRLPFYVQSYGHFKALSSYYTEREGMYSYLLIYTISGCGFLKYKGNEYMLQPRQAVIFNCYEYQLYKTVSEVPWNFKWVHFDGTSAKEYYDILNGDSLSIISVNEESEVNNMLDNIHKAIADANVLTDIKNVSSLINIISELISDKYVLTNNNKFQLHRNEIHCVIDYIHLNYNRKICACEFEKLVLMSKFHFIRLFKSYTGTSPYEYLMNYRIRMSKKLLKETDLNINEISLQVGFGDANNFIRYFKKLSGTTPLNYRKYFIY